MTVPLDKEGHIIAVPLVTWGHIRPLLRLCVNLLVMHPQLRVTMLVPHEAAVRVSKELNGASYEHVHSNTKASGEEALIKRLQVVQVLSPVSAAADWERLYKNGWKPGQEMDLKDALPPLLTGGNELVRGGLANSFAGIPANLVIFDLFLAFVPPMVKAAIQDLGRSMLAMFAFAPCNAAAVYHWFALKDPGGWIDLMIDQIRRDVENGVEEEEAWTTRGFYTDGHTVDIPGLPTRFDYEYFPQLGNLDTPPMMGKGGAAFLDSFQHPDTTGMLITCPQELEPVTHAAFEKHTGRVLLMAGYQASSQAWDAVPPTVDLSTNAEDKEILSFLDRTLAEHGPRKVAYISFGTLFFPQHRPELVLWLFQTLSDAGIPFIFAYASEVYAVPDEVVAYVEKNPLARAARFAPQWSILCHPATGFFVSHCGGNSSAEAILSETPLVSVPFAGDQGEIAAMLTQLGIAIDLKEVKSFRSPEFKRLSDGTTITGTEAAIKAEFNKVCKDILGSKGDQMRVKLREVHELARRSKDEGVARDVMEGISAYF